jgi:hypothetical protein
MGNGSVTPGGAYPANAVVAVTASPGANAFFSGWTGSLNSSADPLSVTMTSNLTLFANFTSMQTQTISFAAPTVAIFPGPSIPLSATASSGLPVVFALLSGPAILVGNQLTSTGAGAIVVQASQGGNSLWLPATSVTAAITVNPAPSIARIRFNATGLDAHASAPASGMSSLWTDPAGLQNSPWPSFANPAPAPAGPANVVLPTAPPAGR